MKHNLIKYVFCVNFCNFTYQHFLFNLFLCFIRYLNVYKLYLRIEMCILKFLCFYFVCFANTKN